ncbi:hypothetical protein [Phaeobacter porticola]|uniref:Uncharacterized protein n=1 Tax=Phaeobacter porticola TaxID=1844006 RepID=A0A1L3IAR6_9RHOB|nr:hypothetical protein [Phaeobacter porticola]APG49123.1 hypothetical protein PhaeoP97_03773 [Phaeobacter porticola]
MQDRPSASDGSQIIMSQKSEVVKSRVSPDSKARFEAVAAEHGVSPSKFLRQLVETVSGDAEVPSSKPSQARREGKLTVRLATSVRDEIEKEAREQGVPPSTWAARILTARTLSAPQPVQGERRNIRSGFRQLRGAATTLNQIAAAMNRGGFTGRNYAPARNGLNELRDSVESLRELLRQYAAGRLKFQLGGDLTDE